MITGNSFLVLEPDGEKSSLARIREYDFNVNNIDIEYGELLLFNNTTSLPKHSIYKYKPIILPFDIRDTLIKRCEKNSLFHVSKCLSEIYLKIAEILNEELSNNYRGIQVFCSIFSYDFCLLSSETTNDLDLIAKYIVSFLKEHLDVDYFKYDTEMFQADIDTMRVQRKLTQCLLSDRQFVKYNPTFSKYIRTKNKIDNINCDSGDKKEELSLFSLLLIKDLVEETHLYWMYESGEVRYENAAKRYILSNRNRQYFRDFELFCDQAQLGNVFHDWVWSLVFLTQTLLASFLERKKSQKDNDETHSNFFGFIPIFKNSLNRDSELTSHFSQHISKKFCHGFLVVPIYSIQNLPKYFPAYVHEFFHYIPPLNREKRNSVILDLVLHALLHEYRIELPASVYDDIFEIFKQNVIKVFYFYNFTEDTVFSCDSMEYVERLTSAFKKLNFLEVSSFVSQFISNTYNKNYDLIVSYLNGKLCAEFSQKARIYIDTFVSFFREIRSDISMCLLLDIGLEQYIKILAEESSFAALNAYDCADSTILRFGFMCRLLSDGKYLVDAKSWLKKCCDIIDECASSDKYADDPITINNFDNLKSYLYEYVSLAIEMEDDQYTPKEDSLLESIIKKEEIVDCWINSIKQYAKHPFATEIRNLYWSYNKLTDPIDKLLVLLGMKILFRDLYSYNPNLDLI